MRNLAARPPRSRETGAVAVIVAVSFTTLFALTALAVDVGYLYQSRQSIQTVADEAVMAGLPDLTNTSNTTAIANATLIATANGYAGASVTGPSAGQLRVEIDVTKQLFFSRIFGLSSKSMNVVSLGRLVNPPALFGGSTICNPSGGGQSVAINGSVTVNGDVESNAGFYGGGPTSVTGALDYSSSCTCQENFAACTGASASGGGYPFPFNYTTSSFTCTVGSMTGPSIPNAPCNYTNAVYCSGGSINVPGGCPVTGTVTFVAVGQILINGNGVNLTAAQNGVIAFSLSSNPCTNPAINLGNGTVTLTGSLIAQNGCVSTNAGSFTLNGSVAASQIGIQGTSTITPVASGGSYQLYQ